MIIIIFTKRKRRRDPCVFPLCCMTMTVVCGSLVIAASRGMLVVRYSFYFFFKLEILPFSSPFLCEIVFSIFVHYILYQSVEWRVKRACVIVFEAFGGQMFIFFNYRPVYFPYFKEKTWGGNDVPTGMQRETQLFRQGFYTLDDSPNIPLCN